MDRGGYGRVGEIRILVVMVVNAVGVIVGRDGSVVRGNYDRSTGIRRHPHHDYAVALSRKEFGAATGNTTVTVVITNAGLSDRDLSQFATQVHSSIHRAIQPFHTSLDGDVLSR